MSRLLPLLCLFGVLGGAAAQDQPPSQNPLEMMPRTAIAGIYLNLEPDNASVQVLNNARDPNASAAADEMAQALSRMASLAGLSIDLKADLLSLLGPRVVFAISPPPVGGKVPTVTLIASAKDPRKVADTLSAIFGAAARNDTDEVAPRGRSLLHQLKAPDGTVHVAYASTPSLVLASTSPEAIGPVLEGEVLAPDSALVRGLQESPDAVATFFVDMARASGAQQPPANAPTSASGSLRFTEEGIQKEMALNFASPQKEGLIAALASVPSVKGDALNAVPADSLAVISVGSPGAIIDLGGQIGGLPGVPKQIGQILQMLGPLAGLLKSDTAFAIRGLVPKPSWMGVLASQDASAAATQLTTLLTTLTSFGQMKARDVPFAGYTMHFLEGQDGKGGPKAVLTQVDRYVFVSGDRRSTEEAMAAATGKARSASAGDDFALVDRHALPDAKLKVFASLRPVSGAGDLLASMILMGSPLAKQAQEAFRSLKGMGFSMAADQQAVRVRIFVGMSPFRVSGMAPLMGAAVATVAGVALPAVAKARENARQASCLSNLKQLSMALNMYANDWGGKLPPASRWVAALKPYIKSEAVFRCPSDRSGHPVNYAMNSRLSGRKLGDIVNPAAAIVLFDSSSESPNPADAGASLAKRHNGGANVAYVDGHCKWLRDVPASELAPAIRQPAPKPEAPVRKAPPARPPVRKGR